MLKLGSPIRSIIVLASLVGLAIVPIYTAPVTTSAPALVPVPISGFGPSSRLATGDLNGDGHADLIAGAYEFSADTTIGVAISDGTGGFSSVARYDAGPEPVAVAVADMNGDGHQDVVVANRNRYYSGGSIAVLFGDGTGALAAPITYAFDFAKALATGDFTGDGVPDVVVLHGTSMTLFANDGTGNLSPATTVAVNPSGSNPISIEAADFDRDGNLDVAIVSYSQVFHTNTSLTTYRGHGNGTFGGRVDYTSNAAGGGYFSAGTQFHALAIDDMNGDGYPDIVVTSQGHTSFPAAAAAWVMLNNGAGGFPSPVKYLQPVGVTGVAIGDMNDDGFVDIVIGDVRGATVRQLFNDGTGTLGGEVLTSVGAVWVVLGDFNNSGPGTLDIVVGGGGGDPNILLIGTPQATACSAGTYSATGDAPCTEAPMGSFVATEGATEATLCPVGTYSSVTGAESCAPAPAGSFVDTVGATGSLLCPAGSYSATIGSASCTLAEPGFYVPTIGESSQTACPAGMVSEAGATACSLPRNVVCNVATGHCYEYVAGPLNWDDARAAAEAMTYNGMAGHLATMTSQAETDFIVANLPAAVFQYPDFVGGAWIGGFQLPGSAEPSGGWQWVTGEPWSFTKWASGEPNNAGNEDVLNFWSTAGHWNDVNRTVLKGYLIEYPSPAPPPACGAGTYSATGTEPCIEAPMGSFVATDGATSATLCPVGSYSNVTGATSCTLAPAGSYVDTDGATSATPCQAGTYSATEGAASCTAADAGFFVPTAGATSQTACAEGSYSSAPGATSCTLAPAGSYVDTTGATSATLCPAGTYAAITGSSSCTPADAGFFVPTSGATSQTACPVHYWSDGGATECYPLDSDGDGVYDKDDAYLNSDMSPTVRVGTCVTTVTNQVLANGATFNDLIATAQAGARNHGQFVSAVTQLAGAWQKAGLISGRDHGMITSCAARSR